MKKKYVCTVCGWVYDPDKGDPDGGILPGTPFEEIPYDWVCPLCGVGKDDDCGYEGYIRPDHGRHLWDEGPGNVRPGYGLYDRALGIMYMLGVWDMLDNAAGKVTVANSN